MCILYIILMLDTVYFQSQLCDCNSRGAWAVRDAALGLFIIVFMTIPSYVLQPL